MGHGERTDSQSSLEQGRYLHCRIISQPCSSPVHALGRYARLRTHLFRTVDGVAKVRFAVQDTKGRA